MKVSELIKKLIENDLIVAVKGQGEGVFFAQSDKYTVIKGETDMSNTTTFVTINHLTDYPVGNRLKVNDTLTLRKDLNNEYDDEAIAAYGRHGLKCGYVANSVITVARGTLSAGRIYDRFEQECKCIIRFIMEDQIIAEVTI